MRLKAVNLIAAVTLALPMAVYADSFSYRYVDAAHLPNAEIDGDGGVDVDGDGIQLRGSLPVQGNIFALAELQDLDLDFGVDATRLMVGVGGHWPMNGMDIIARGGVVQLEIDAGNFEDDDTGLFVGARLRANIAPKIEVEAGVEHVRVEVAGLENDTYLIGEGRYNFNPQWSAGVLFTVGGDTSVMGVQGRLSF